MTNAVSQALSLLIDKAIAQTPSGHFEHEQYDPEWRSPCEINGPDARGTILWKPLKRAETLDFSGLEKALELILHDDIKTYYSSFYSDTIEAKSEEGRVSLIQLWNDEDFIQLAENLVGHFLAKKKLNHPFTVFFATTEKDSEYFLSIDNETGSVLLEEPGKEPLQDVESSLAKFLNRLTPTP